MHHATADEDGATAEAAIGEVLDAQARARADLHAARAEAAARIARAREDARRIAARAGERLQRALARHEGALREAVAGIDAALPPDADATVDPRALEDAVRAVAADLAGSAA